MYSTGQVNAISIYCRLSSQVLDLPELAPMIGKRVQIIVLDLSDEPDEAVPPLPPQGDTVEGESLVALVTDQSPDAIVDVP